MPTPRKTDKDRRIAEPGALGDKPGRLLLQMPAALWRAVQDAAERDGVSVSLWLRRAAEAKLLRALWNR